MCVVTCVFTRSVSPYALNFPNSGSPHPAFPIPFGFVYINANSFENTLCIREQLEPVGEDPCEGEGELR